MFGAVSECRTESLSATVGLEAAQLAKDRRRWRRGPPPDPRSPRAATDATAASFTSTIGGLTSPRSTAVRATDVFGSPGAVAFGRKIGEQDDRARPGEPERARHLGGAVGRGGGIDRIQHHLPAEGHAAHGVGVEVPAHQHYRARDRLGRHRSLEEARAAVEPRLRRDPAGLERDAGVRRLEPTPGDRIALQERPAVAGRVAARSARNWSATYLAVSSSPRLGVSRPSIESSAMMPMRRATSAGVMDAAACVGRGRGLGRERAPSRGRGRRGRDDAYGDGPGGGCRRTNAGGL